jgi:hypothetical protein
MAKKIKTFKFNGKSIQNGIGIPKHVSSKGDEFTDTSTNKTYINKNGKNIWELKVVTGTTNTITITGGTINDEKNTLILEKNDGNDLTITGDTLYFETKMYFNVEQTGIGVEFSDSNGHIKKVFNINTIEAIQNNNGIRIQLNGGLKIIINQLNLSSIYINGDLVTQVLETALNELNALFQNTGNIGGNTPTITSPTTIYLTLGNSINYTLTGTDAVAYSWDNLPNGIVTLEGNTKTIIGGSALLAGTYTFNGIITNYYGEVNTTITLIVSPAFVNTYSVNGQWQVHYTNSVSGEENNTPLYRPTMTGTASDAWSMMCWFKWRTSNYNYQTIFHFGHPDSNTDGKTYVQVKRKNGTNYISILLFYGSNQDYLQQEYLTTISYTGWHNLLITYTGGDTGNNPSNISTYHNQFKIFLDGNQQSPTTLTNGNNGYTGSINGTSNSSSPLRLLRKGYFNNFAPYLYVDEMSFWDSDVSADSSTLYNGSTPLDLTTLYTPLYTDYYRFGDGPLDISSFPTMSNLGPGPNLTMISGTVAKYITDVP